MPFPGSSGLTLVDYYTGNPTGAPLSEINAPLGTIIIDYVNGLLYQKTSALGDNSGYRTVGGGATTTPVTPLTGATITANAIGESQTFYITPAGTLAALTFVFPTDATSVIGQRLTLISTQIITALTISSSGLTVNGPAVTSLQVNTPVSWIKVAATTWQRDDNSTIPAGATFGGAILSSSPSGGVGYATGAGATVSQATNRSTGVTINAVSGQITGQATSLAAGAEAIFVVTNSACGLNDVPVLAVQSGPTANTSVFSVSTVTAGSFSVKAHNLHATTADTGAPIINFTIFKGSAS